MSDDIGAELPQVQHDFGDAASEKNAHGWMVRWAVGQRIHNPWDAAIERDPVVNRWARQFRGE